jgi:hypothetical protein
MQCRWILLIWLVAGAAGCGNGKSDEDTTPAPTDVASDTTLSSLISCDNACKRQPLCAPDLVTEQDCLAVCNSERDPSLYACCIQTAITCSAVEDCTSKANVVCDDSVEPWVPIPNLEECVCGEPGIPTPANKECIATGPDHRCETGVCLKPVNTPNAPFCVIECTNAPDKCPESMKCTMTPKTWYCDF